VEAMHAEIAGLRRELGVTEEVGKVVFAALRTKPELVQNPSRARGLAPIQHFLGFRTSRGRLPRGADQY
jgi:hypothetical protein